MTSQSFNEVSGYESDLHAQQDLAEIRQYNPLHKDGRTSWQRYQEFFMEEQGLDKSKEDREFNTHSGNLVALSGLGMSVRDMATLDELSTDESDFTL